MFQKSHEDLRQLQTSSGKSKKLKLDGLLWSEKYICPKNTFTTQLLCIFLAQTLHIYFLQKQPIKVQVFGLSTARVKVHQIPHVIFRTKSQFFFKLCITLQCHKTYSSVFFHLNLYMLWTKGSDQSADF